MRADVELRDERSEWISSPLLERLNGRLWHATSADGLSGILHDRAIRADAATKHSTAYVRSIGGVSLFDLAEPDIGIHPVAAHWSDWLRDRTGTPYWLEVDRAAVADQFIGTRETYRRWQERLDAGGMTATRLIANIEAAHIGSIPLCQVNAIIAVDHGRRIALPPEFKACRSL